MLNKNVKNHVVSPQGTRMTIESLPGGTCHVQGYGTQLRFFVYELRDWTPAGNAERGLQMVNKS